MNEGWRNRYSGCGLRRQKEEIKCEAGEMKEIEKKRKKIRK